MRLQGHPAAAPVQDDDFRSGTELRHDRGGPAALETGRVHEQQTPQSRSLGVGLQVPEASIARKCGDLDALALSGTDLIH